VCVIAKVLIATVLWGGRLRFGMGGGGAPVTVGARAVLCQR
jgi:hypothetical protein